MVGGGGTPKEAVSWEKPVIAFAVFAVGNVGLNYFNSWALRAPPSGIPGVGKGGFGFPFFYTMFHMLASSIAALLLQCTCARPKDGKMPSFGQLWDYKYSLFPIAVLTVLNNGLNNMSLQMVALFVNQVIKACTPAPAAFFEFVVQRKIYGWKIYATVCCICAGSVLATAGSWGSGGATSILGVVVCIISLLASALKPVFQNMLTNVNGTDKPPLQPSQALFWDAGISFFIMMIVWLCSQERDKSLAYIEGHTANPKSGLLAMLIICCGSTMAFTFNIAVYYFIMYTSALTSTIGSNGVKIFLICITAVTDGMTSDLTMCGAGLVVVSIIGYAYFSYQEKNAKAATSDVKDEKTANEETPLTQKLTEAVSAFPLLVVAAIACVALILGMFVFIPMYVIHHKGGVGGNTTSLSL